MPNIALFPHPASWLSAGLLSGCLVLLGLWLGFLGPVAPRIYERIEPSRRLVALDPLALLALWMRRARCGER